VRWSGPARNPGATPPLVEDGEIVEYRVELKIGFEYEAGD
jgi:hypothetical protein